MEGACLSGKKPSKSLGKQGGRVNIIPFWLVFMLLMFNSWSTMINHGSIHHENQTKNTRSDPPRTTKISHSMTSGAMYSGVPARVLVLLSTSKRQWVLEVGSAEKWHVQPKKMTELRANHPWLIVPACTIRTVWNRNLEQKKLSWSRWQHLTNFNLSQPCWLWCPYNHWPVLWVDSWSKAKPTSENEKKKKHSNHLRRKSSEAHITELRIALPETKIWYQLWHFWTACSIVLQALGSRHLVFWDGQNREGHSTNVMSNRILPYLAWTFPSGSNCSTPEVMFFF